MLCALAASDLRPLRAEVLAMALAALRRCLGVGGAAMPADGLEEIRLAAEFCLEWVT